MRNLGTSSVLMAEFWGIFTALSMCWDMSFRYLWIESDSMVAVSLVNNGCQENHPYAPIIFAIKELMRRSWVVRLTHVLREGNRLADSLANLAHSKDLGLHWLESPPLECREVLFQDLTGVSFSRLCS